jgi:hypothetical protein
MNHSEDNASGLEFIKDVFMELEALDYSVRFAAFHISGIVAPMQVIQMK